MTAKIKTGTVIRELVKTLQGPSTQHLLAAPGSHRCTRVAVIEDGPEKPLVRWHLRPHAVCLQIRQEGIPVAVENLAGVAICHVLLASPVALPNLVPLKFIRIVRDVAVVDDIALVI